MSMKVGSCEISIRRDTMFNCDKKNKIIDSKDILIMQFYSWFRYIVQQITFFLL